MKLKDKILEIFPDAELLKLPSWLKEEVVKNNAIIKSYTWKSDRIRKIRLCELNIKNKFSAETLVIYPEFCYETPILGTEYLKMSNKKFFGAVDLHPLKMDEEYNRKYIQKYLGDLPNRDMDVSKIYDLDKYFSKKFWIKRKETDFYQDYLKVVDAYLNRFKSCLKESSQTISSYSLHKGYDTHLAVTDPAYGILKAYFDSDFSERYISTFLFDLNFS
jgi:15,16-dihydrobiliverdin:ferredoxin oxidoreductase